MRRDPRRQRSPIRSELDRRTQRHPLRAVYAPVALPSPDRGPPPAAGQTWEAGQSADNWQRWNDNAKAWNDRALERINHNRIRLGLEPIYDVLAHVLTSHPWLAADPNLAPLPSTPGMHEPLAPPEQPLFRRIAVFVGGCTLSPPRPGVEDPIGTCQTE